MSVPSNLKPPAPVNPAGDEGDPSVLLDNLHVVYTDPRTLAWVVGGVLRDDNVRNQFKRVELHPWKSLRLSDADSQSDLVVSALWRMREPSWFKDLNRIIGHDTGQLSPACSVKFRGKATRLTGGKTSYLKVLAETTELRIRLSAQGGRLADLADLLNRKVWILGLIWKIQPLSITAASVSVPV